MRKELKEVRVSQGGYLGKSIPSRGNGKCKGPEVGVCQHVAELTRKPYYWSRFDVDFSFRWVGVLQTGLLALYAFVLLVCV